jgi:GAF domain-containing protein
LDTPLDTPLDRAVADAVREMANQPSTALTAERAVAMCVDVVAGCDMAGVAIHRSQGAEVVAATTETLRDIAQWQHDLREGPCFDALRGQEVVVSDDLETDDRWPTFGRRLAAETGIHAAVSFRLFTSEETLGALNLYGRGVGAFGPQQVAEGQALAAHIAVAVLASRQREQLEQALVHRTVIGQATGILIERFGLEPEVAFAALSRVSQTRNLKLYALAEQLVESGRLPFPAPRNPRR